MALLALPPVSASAAGIVLRETGSTLLYPLFGLWIRDYPGVAPGVTLTAAATGSGAGEEQVIAGQAHIGASDAYMSDVQVAQNPEIKNIPLAISAQTVNYNIAGLSAATSSTVISSAAVSSAPTSNLLQQLQYILYVEP